MNTELIYLQPKFIDLLPDKSILSISIYSSGSRFTNIYYTPFQLSSVNSHLLKFISPIFK